MPEHRIESAELSPDEIGATVEAVLLWAREHCGKEIGARSVDLRLWAAAALIDSTLRVSVKAGITRSLEQKLDFLRALTESSGT